MNRSLVAVLLFAAAANRVSAQAIAVVGGTLIDGNGGPPVANSVIVSEKGRIVAIGEASRITIPPGTRQLDAAGKSSSPG